MVKSKARSELERDLEAKRLLEAGEKILKKHPLPADTGSEFGKGFLYCLTLFACHFSNDQADNIKKFSFLMHMNPADRELAMSDDPPPHLNYGKDMEHAFFYWKKIQPIYETPEKTLSSMITLWANGSSDHLYEIECPEKFKNGVVEVKVMELRNKGLDMGHGFKNKIYTIEDMVELITLTADIVKLVDKELGVETIQARFGEL